MTHLEKLIKDYEEKGRHVKAAKLREAGEDFMKVAFAIKRDNPDMDDATIHLLAAIAAAALVS